MKRIIFFIFLFLFNISFIVSADDGSAVINLQHKVMMTTGNSLLLQFSLRCIMTMLHRRL